MSLEKIIILAMGPTWGKCPKQAPLNSEIWGVNTTYRYGVDVDRIFCMHDLREEILLQDYDFIDNLNDLNIPVYTAGDYPALTKNVPFPLQEVYDYFKIMFFLNTMTYMIAYAIMQEPKEIMLFGVDMRPDSGHEHHTDERGCVEFWVGVAMGKGINVVIPEESYILKRTMTGSFYGYKARAAQNGMYQLFPINANRNIKRFKLVPIDDFGKECGDPVITEFKPSENPELQKHFAQQEAERGII